MKWSSHGIEVHAASPSHASSHWEADQLRRAPSVRARATAGCLSRRYPSSWPALPLCATGYPRLLDVLFRTFKNFIASTWVFLPS